MVYVICTFSCVQPVFAFEVPEVLRLWLRMLISGCRNTWEQGALCLWAVRAVVPHLWGLLHAFVARKQNLQVPVPLGLLPWEHEEISSWFAIYPVQQA